MTVGTTGRVPTRVIEQATTQRADSAAGLPPDPQVALDDRPQAAPPSARRVPTAPTDPSIALAPPSAAGSPEIAYDSLIRLASLSTFVRELHTKGVLTTELDDNASVRIQQKLVELLDPDHLYFTTENVSGFEAFRSLFDNAFMGTTDAELEASLSIVERMLLQRQRATTAFTSYARERLAQGSLDTLAVSGTFERDATKRGFCANAAAREALWDAFLWNRVLEGRAAGAARGESTAQSDARVRAELDEWLTAQESWVSTELGNDGIEVLFDAYLSLQDRYSRYTAPGAVANQERAELQGRTGGLGLTIPEQPFGSYRIGEVYPGGPAGQCGRVFAGDEIIAVGSPGANQQSTDGMTRQELLRALRGELGTKVTVTVRHENGATEAVELTRAVFEAPTLAARATLLEVPAENGGNDRVGVVRIPVFTSSSPAQVRAELARLDAEHGRVDAYVIDLRGNPGGSMPAANEIASLFIGSAADQSGTGSDFSGRPTFQAVSVTGETTVYHDVNREFRDQAIVVLVDQGTASAAEILTATLQDHSGALVVGDTPTHKGCYQRPWVFDNADLDFGDMFVTYGRYLPVAPGAQWGGENTVPVDLFFPNQFGHTARGGEPVRDAAAVSAGRLDGDLVAQLRAAWQARVGGNPELAAAAEHASALSRATAGSAVSLDADLRLAQEAERNSLLRGLYGAPSTPVSTAESFSSAARTDIWLNQGAWLAGQLRRLRAANAANPHP